MDIFVVVNEENLTTNPGEYLHRIFLSREQAEAAIEKGKLEQERNPRIAGWSQAKIWQFRKVDGQ